MLAKGQIRKSTIDVGVATIFVLKPNGDLRLVIDYRVLNDITIKNRYPLLNIDEILDRLQRL